MKTIKKTYLNTGICKIPCEVIVTQKPQNTTQKKYVLPFKICCNILIYIFLQLISIHISTVFHQLLTSK